MKKHLLCYVLLLLFGILKSQSNPPTFTGDEIEESSSFSDGEINEKAGSILADTKGELTVNGMGAANYKVPIALPPGIKDVAPQIALTYSSSGNNGIAGYGWNIVGISSITRISTRIDIDGYVDGVDFDDNDQFALDGQRLIKDGRMDASGSNVYYTENYSNLKIRSTGTYTYPDASGPGPEKFTITFPDGTQAFYSTTTNSRGVSEWLIDKWIDPQGNTIKYEYSNNSNVTYIKKITWSENANTSTNEYFNTIEFFYKSRLRPEMAYLHGVKMTNSRLLDYIEVRTGGQLSRKYQLSHIENELKYQNVSQIQEFNGNNEPANPIVFNYENSQSGFSDFPKFTSSESNYLNDVQYSGDFDGNGKMDFIVSSVGIKLFLNSIDNNAWNPINVPTNGASVIPPISTLKGGKLMQLQSLVFKTYNTSSGSYHDPSIRANHELYLKPQIRNTSTNQFTENYTRTVPYPFLNYTIDSDGCMNMGTNLDKYTGSPDTRFLEGDFNGDGISDYILVGRYKVTNYFIDPDWEKGDGTSARPEPGCNPHTSHQNISPYFINMNPLVSDNEAVVRMTYGTSIGYTDKQFVIDFDGDGKSDILNITSYGFYKVYTFTNPLQPETLATGTISEYNLTNDPEKQLVWGDFNGDGKMDLMIPHAKDSSNWSMYISKGDSFEKVIYNDFILYLPYWQGSPSANRTRIKQYRAIDLNKDGKSDFLMNEYESWTQSPNNRDARGHFYLKPNLGLDSNGKIIFGSDQHTQVESEYGYDDAIHLLTGDYNNGNHDIVFIQGNQIWKGNYKKDQSKDIRLKSVSEVGEKILSELTYSPLTPNSANGGLGDVNGTYYSSNQENYPFVEIKQLPNLNVVTKLKVSAMGSSKERQFKYFGLTSHSHGWGILGFKKMAQSSWVTSGINTKIWQVSQMSPSLRGAATDNWSFSGNNLSLITNPIESQLLGKKTISYFTYHYPNKRYVQLPQTQTEKDILTGVTKVTTSEFDNYYNLKKSTLQIAGTNATYKTDYVYANNPSGTGVNYYIGRLTKKNATSTAYGNTRTSEEKYTYNGTLLSKIETKGHNTDYVTETFQYDGFGNVVQKTTSAPGVSSRTIKDEYSPTGRFVVKKTDVDGLITTLTYNSLGQVLTQKDPLNTQVTNVYDHWGKLMSMTISGASSTPLVTTYAYYRDADGALVVSSNNTQTKEYSETQTDVLGRTFKNITKGFASGTKIVKTTEYDFLGRVIKESEPYFSTGSPTQWNTIVYDDLSRPIKQTSFTGKVTNISYNGLSVTTTENGKTKTITKDAVGNVASVSDNGEVINYGYYATNELKTSTYGGHTVTVGIDGWGRKSSLLDPSVSTTPYTYEYNNYGELLEETTPNGVTNYSYLPTGKLDYKTITGDNTHIIAYYSYTDKGLIETESGTSNGESYSTAYEYDGIYRLEKKTERQGYPSSPDFIIKKEYTYDSYSRILTEKTNTDILMDNKTSTVTVKNNYNAYNGLLDHITDAASGATIWKLTGANARMQTLSAQLGNGVNIANTYNAYGYIQNIRHTKSGITAPLSLNYTFNVQKGTLTNRKNNFYNYTEHFTYDNFDRLLSWTTPGGVENNTYETDGRIKTNSSTGSYAYDGAAKYKKKSVSLTNAGRIYYTQRTPQTVVYNAFKKPVSITEKSRGTIEFEYGIGLVRTRAAEWTTDEPSGNLSDIVRTKYYSSDGSVEIIQKGAAGSGNHPRTRIITYIGGNAYSAPAMYVTDYQSSGTKTNDYCYLHRDFQGSIMAISNAYSVLERRHYDAWGNISKFTNSVGVMVPPSDLIGSEFFFDRGYTGHEHFFRVGIIHMNGRIYDPVLKGFMSPDNFVQDPQNSQNFNRYAYCYNNPLMYTDQSGEWVVAGSAVLGATIIGAIIGGVTYTGISLYQGNFTWVGLLKSVGIGAVTGAISGGLSSLSSTMSTASSTTSSFWNSYTFNVLSELTTQSVGTVLSGGELDWTVMLSSLAGAYVGAKLGSWKPVEGGWGRNALGEIGFSAKKGALMGATSGFTKSLLSPNLSLKGLMNDTFVGARQGAISSTAMAVGKIAAFGATYIPTDDQLEYVKKMSDKYGVSYENVQWRKGGIYQGIQSLLDYRREVTWGNTVATFRGTSPDVFGHEFGHIIQFNTQGWATFQGKGIYEQFLNFIFGTSVYDSKMYNEGSAESMLQSVGGCTNFDVFYQCIKL